MRYGIIFAKDGSSNSFMHTDKQQSLTNAKRTLTSSKHILKHSLRRSSRLSSRHTSRHMIVTSLWLLFVLLCYGLFRNLVVIQAEHPTVLNTVFLDTTSPTFTISTAGASDAISYSVTNFSGAIVTKGQAYATGGQVYLTLPELADNY